jgi:hypothetical protein
VIVFAFLVEKYNFSLSYRELGASEYKTSKSLGFSVDAPLWNLNTIQIQQQTLHNVKA